jgi:hypothetical protein
MASSNTYVTPDIIVERQGGEWVPVMNNDDLPHLRLSNSYKDMLSQPEQQHRGAQLHPRQAPQRQIPHPLHPPAPADHLQRSPSKSWPTSWSFSTRAPATCAR